LHITGTSIETHAQRAHMRKWHCSDGSNLCLKETMVNTDKNQISLLV
jgi:hypothetical protein